MTVQRADDGQFEVEGREIEALLVALELEDSGFVDAGGLSDMVNVGGHVGLRPGVGLAAVEAGAVRQGNEEVDVGSTMVGGAFRKGAARCDVDKGATSYVPGDILYVRKRRLMAQPFDEDRLEIRGEPFPIGERCRTTS